MGTDGRCQDDVPDSLLPREKESIYRTVKSKPPAVWTHRPRTGTQAAPTAGSPAQPPEPNTPLPDFQGSGPNVETQTHSLNFSCFQLASLSGPIKKFPSANACVLGRVLLSQQLSNRFQRLHLKAPIKQGLPSISVKSPHLPQCCPLSIPFLQCLRSLSTQDVATVSPSIHSSPTAAWLLCSPRHQNTPAMVTLTS